MNTSSAAESGVEVREDHATTAIDFADEADSCTEHLQSLYAADRRDSEEIAQVHQRLRTSIKLAEVNALLAIADEVRRLREQLEPKPKPSKPTCVRANGMICPEHKVEHSRVSYLGEGDPHR